MKLMIASDIHGSALYCQDLLGSLEREGAQRLVLLGDLLYHGPRNDLPDLYDPKRVASMLNGVKERLLCIRGNCDAEVDQMMLEFPIGADYAVLFAGERMIYATHGHVYNEQHTPPLSAGDILLYGHTHIPACTERNGILFLNPGSVSIPKGDSVRSYMTFDGNEFLWKAIEDGAVLSSFRLDEA